VSDPERRCVVDLARPAQIARYAGRTVLVASVIPTGLFYATMALAGLQAAVLVAVGWYYLCLLWRTLRRRPVLGATMLGAGLFTARTLTVFWTGSAYLYFLQPVAGTVATATSFAVTALAGRPLVERLAHDFVPIPPVLSERLRAAKFFDYTSFLWALTYGINAVGTVWLLTSSSLGAFLLLKTLLSPVLTGAAIAATYLLFRRLTARAGVEVRWQTRAVTA